MGFLVQNYLFDIFDTLFLALCTDEFIIVGNPEQYMLWCVKNLTIEVEMKDKGGW